MLIAILASVAVVGWVANAMAYFCTSSKSMGGEARMSNAFMAVVGLVPWLLALGTIFGVIMDEIDRLRESP